MRAVRRQDDDLRFVVLRGSVESAVQFVEELGVLGIARFRTVERDARNPAIGLVEQ